MIDIIDKPHVRHAIARIVAEYNTRFDLEYIESVMKRFSDELKNQVRENELQCGKSIARATMGFRVEMRRVLSTYYIDYLIEGSVLFWENR